MNRRRFIRTLGLTGLAGSVLLEARQRREAPRTEPASPARVFGQLTQLLPYTLNAPSRQLEFAVRYWF